MLAFGCSRLGPGELGEASVVVTRWTAVGEARVERTYAEYQLRATCMNAGGPVSGVAALVVSTSPATTILENQIRCGPIDERSTAPTIDTITIRQDRTLPFSPRSLNGVALVWAPETQESETRVDRVHFDYGYYAYLENGLAAPADVVATVESTSSATVILDDTVAESALDSRKRRGSVDRFAFRHDRGVAFDPTTLVWTLAFGGAQRPGFVAGEVYDDATGRALAGVAVQMQGGGATTTDGQGAYQLPGTGVAIVGFTRDGYTPAWREVLVPGGGVATPLDVRLRPRARPIALTSRDGGAIPSGNATLDVPVASLRSDATVSLTELGAQALPAPLPLGWAPLASFEIDTGGVALGAPLALVLPNTTPDPARDVAVRFDAETRRWLRTELEGGAGARIPIARAGAVALARRDLVPASPPLPELDAALEGVAAVSIPDASSAELLPSPRVLFASNDARADVRAVLRSAVPLPSGTPLRVDFAERYLRLDAATVEPPPMAQDLLLYPGAEGPEAAFVATPSPAIEPASLREGTIDLAANVRDAVTGAAVLDGAGGTLTNGALALTVPPGALAAPIVASLAPFVPLDPALTGDARFSVLGGAAVGFGAATLSAPARLTLPLPAGTDVGDDLLVVVAPRTVLGATRWELVGVARVDGDTLVVEPGTTPPLPGIRASDRYAVVRLLVPAGFVAGTVRDATGAPAADALVSVDTLPFVGRTEAGDPRYAVVAAVGDARIEGLELTRGDAAQQVVPIPANADVATRDLALLATRPQVVAVVPAPDADAVPVLSGVEVIFDRPMDAASVTPASVRLSASGTPVAAALSLSPDRRTLTLRPAGPLDGRTQHALRIDTSVRDAFGSPLDGNQSDGAFEASFTTAASEAPPRPAAGEISLSIPRDGTSEIRGTAGSAQPGDLVTAFDVTSGATASVIAGADGSFSIDLPTAIANRVELSIRDALGRETRFDPGPFADPDGFVVVGSAGGTIAGSGGVTATVPPGAVPDGTVVRIAGIGPESAQAPVPGFLSLVTGVVVEMGDVVATDEIDVALPLAAGHGFDPTVEWVMLEERDFFGEPRFAVVNVAHVRGDRVETASPPFPGVRRSGKYLLGPPNVPIGIVSALMSAGFVPSILFLAAANVELIASGSFFPLFIIPQDMPFSITVFDGPANPVLTLPFGALASPDLQQIAIPAPDDGSPFAADVLLPVNDAEGVLGAVTLLAVFNKELDQANVEANFGLFELPGATPVAGRIEVLDVDGIPRAVRFKPARRLRFDTEYRMSLQGICPFGAQQGGTCTRPLTTSDPTFRTFAAQRLAAVTVGDPNDVAAWAPSPDAPTDRVVVANGTLQNADQTGVVIVDVSDPAAPTVLSERPIVGRTLGVVALDDATFTSAAGATVASGPAVLAVSGGIDVSSNLRILRSGPNATGIERAELESVGASLLSTPNAALQNGTVLADVPPFVGTPRGLAFLAGDPNGAAYVAMIGVGVQGVDTQNTAGTVRALPGLFSAASIAAVETLGTLVLAGDRNRLFVLTPQLTQIGSLAIPVRALDAVRAFTADLDLDGGIDPASEAFDLAFVVEDATQRLSIVDVSSPGSPSLIAAIPLGRSARDVVVDPVERLAYVGDDLGIQIVDVSNPLEAVGLLDANGDARDDRLLGRVAGATASRSLALSRSGTHGYSGSSATGELETLFLNPGRLFVDHFDPEFPTVRLDDSDYYPNLGAKRIHVRAFEFDGLPGSGEVVAQRVSGPSTVAIEASAPLTGGVATFTIAGPRDALPRQGPLTFEFRWTDSTGATVSTRETYEIRNNSVTNLEEVLGGRAVFVATIETGSDHDGVTARPLEPIDPGYDPTPRPRSFAPLAERKWDFVQEMLNQTLGRKLSAWQARPYPDTPLVEEDGIYFTERDGAMLGFAKQEFAIRVNTQPDDRSPTFRKLMKDYGIDGAAQAAMHDRIVDAETLRMTTLRVQPDRTRPCTPCDVAINAATTGDTGLYELYANVTFRFIEDMVAEGERFRDEATPANAEVRWRYREFRNDGAGVPPAPGDDASRYDGRPGTAYSYGAKQTLEEFESTVSAFSGPTFLDISILFPDYRGNLLDLTPPGVVDAAGSERWIGLESSELALANRAANPVAYFESRYWSGIDCSGFVQRIAAVAADRSPAAALPGFVTSRNESRCAGVAANGVGLCPLRTITQGAGAGYVSGTLKSTFAFNDFTPGFSRGTANVWTKYLEGLGFAIHRGDLMAGPGHIAFIYSTPESPTSDYYLLHAFGMDTYSEGLVSGSGRRARPKKHGMKVLTSGWRGHFNGHSGAVRPLLWE
jgi:hypothetical protein